MALLIDSGFLPDVERVCATYPIGGVTTNPSILLAAVERGQRLAPAAVIRALLGITVGPVFAQPTGETVEAMLAQALRYRDIDPERVVLKLPMSRIGVAVSRELAARDARFAFTATYTGAQAYCGALAGAGWVIPYFGRLRKSGIDAAERIGEMARVLSVLQSPARLLVASVKSSADLIEATLAGAQDVTLPPEIIETLADDSLSGAAIRQFESDASRLALSLAE